MSSKKLIHLSLIAIMLFHLSACGIFKKGTKKSRSKGANSAAVVTPANEPVKTVEVTPNPNMDKNLVDTYTPAWKNEIAFKTFSGKAKCHYDGKGQNYDFTANIRIKKNEAAWIMATALGGMVQVARVYVTPDSFALINYLEKSYISMRIEEVNKVLPFPVDFTMLQNLFIGNALRTDAQIMDAKSSGDVVTLVVKKENLNQDIAINSSSKQISLLRVYLDNDPSEAVVRYNNYSNRDGRSFPQDRVINVSNNGDQHLLEMNFTDAKFDGAVDMPFSVPKNYTKK